MAKQTMEVGIPDMVQISALDIPKVLNNKWTHKTVAGFLGRPGCGKTQAALAYGKKKAQELGLKFNANPKYLDWHNPDLFNFSSVIISQIEEIDTKGLPINVIIDGKQVTIYAISEMFPDAGKGIIFLDEFPNGRTQVQNAMQSIILEHQAGNIKISPDIMFVVAGNRPQDNCGTFYIPSALRNRIAWYEVEAPSTEEWIKFMSTINQPIDHRIAGYLISIGEKHADNFNPESEQYAYGTRRSWTIASDEIRGVNDLEELKIVVGGRVGLGAASDLKAFLKLADKIDIKDLLKNPEKIHKYRDGDIGLLYSICVNMTPFAENEKTVDSVFQVLEKLERDEFGMFIINSMLRSIGNAKTLIMIKASPTALKLARKYLELLNQV